jgi:hypothetical protein
MTRPPAKEVNAYIEAHKGRYGADLQGAAGRPVQLLLGEEAPTLPPAVREGELRAALSRVFAANFGVY